MNSFLLLAYASLAASKTFLWQLLTCLNFTLDSEYPFTWYRKKRFLLLPFSWFLRTMPVAQAAEIHGVEWNLTWYLRWGIYSLIPAWTHSENSLAATEALSLKISSYLSNDHKDCPNQKNSPKLHNEIGHPFEFDRKSVETETT